MKRCLIGLLMLALLFSLGCSGDGGAVDADTVPADTGMVDIQEPLPTEPPLEPSPAPKVAIKSNSGNGMAAAGSYHSVGLRSDGTVVAVGQNTSGQCAVNDWQDMVFITARGELTMGVTGTGTVRAAGLMAEGMAEAQGWTEISMLALGEGHVLGLRRDGTALAAGDNGSGQCAVSGWTDLAQVAAAGEHSVGLKTDGTLLAAGDIPAPDWEGIVAIFTNGSAIFGIDESGRLHSTGGYDTEGLTDIADMAAGDDILLALRGDGSVLCLQGGLDTSTVENGDSLAVGDGHALVVLGDGSVQGLGESGLYQCEVEGWQLYPYAVGKDLLGFAAGSTVEEVTSILRHACKAATVTINSEGMELALADPVPTGAEALADGTSLGRIVIRGELTGDGIVDTADYSAISGHISGTAPLSGVFLEAARIQVNPQNQVMPGAAEAIRRYIEEGRAIRQFQVSGHVYDEDISAAKAVNPDVTGWIRIPGTNIDYPIMKATADYRYNDHNWEGEESTAASVYTYYNEARQGRFYAVTAHNSRVSGTMFHYLHHIYDYNRGESLCSYSRCDNAPELTGSLPDLQNYAERVWRINVNGVEGLWEVYSVYEVKSDADLQVLYNNIWYFEDSIGWSDSLDTLYSSRILSEGEIRGWIDAQIEKSEIPLGVSVSASDELLTLLTCATTSTQADAGGRLYFFLHRVG